MKSIHLFLEGVTVSEVNKKNTNHFMESNFCFLKKGILGLLLVLG